MENKTLKELLNMGFDLCQISEIAKGILDDIDISKYAKREINCEQMRKIRRELESEQNGK